MNAITFPLTPHMTGAAVGDLQELLQLLLDRAIIAPNDPGIRKELTLVLARERTGRGYASATTKCVALFQEAMQLPATGNVDEATAKSLNSMRRQLGVGGATGGGTGGTDTGGNTPTAPEQPVAWVVSGTVTSDSGLPAANIRVRAFHAQAKGGIRLGEDVSDSEGSYTIRYSLLPGLSSVDLVVTASGDDGVTLQTSSVVSAAPPLAQVDLTLPATDATSTARRVEGRLLLDYGEVGENVTLRLYRKTFGGQAALLSETTTKAHGVYALPYSSQQSDSLEVRALDVTGVEIPVSSLVHDDGLSARTVVNLVAPATVKPLAAEFDRLSTALTPHVGSMDRLSAAQETVAQQDLTLLNRASGWDARLIALAANAATLASDRFMPLAQDELYGLFRAGLPTDPLQLAGVGSDVVEQALKSVHDAGIVTVDAARLGTVKERFSNFANLTRLAVRAPGAQSSYSELLQSASVSDEGRNRFAGVYVDHAGDSASLWTKAREAGVSDSDVAALQRQGKFAFLTSNNARMAQHLEQGMQISDPVQLVDRDLDLPDTWKAEVRGLADGVPALLASLVPPAYEGDTIDVRLDAYANDMARKVRVSYPTQVVARMVERDADDVFQLGQSRTPAVSFLRSASASGFRLGSTPVDSFLRENPAVAAGMEAGELRTATQAVKTLQRLYQITPGNDAMLALTKAGLTSAHDITSMSRNEFLERYESYFPSREQAELVYRKAQQVSSITTNLYGIVKEMDSAPSVTAISATPAMKEQAKNELIKHFPTMESLFGSMDFCDCDHCRSVLSPAAYLVDLLHFVDPDASKWQGFLDRWKKDHAGTDYTATYKRPFDALIERRPDLPHIPLTCENTKTALPYIDVVNEILEYYVANNALAPQAAHDTGDATTAELLAEPQHIIPAAYDAVGAATYPIGLPFDLWLETVRGFCNYAETPLAEVMEACRTTDDLFAPAEAFDRSATFVESLGITPAEYAIFTDPDPLDTWFTLYGFATENDATALAVDPSTGQRIDLNSAKALSRRLGVSYQELVDIVRTGFVNPKLESLVVLYKLQVSIGDILLYRDHGALLGADPSTLSKDELARLANLISFQKQLDEATATYSAVGFDARAWVDNAIATNVLDGILVLADPDQGCNFDLTTLRYANGDACDPIAFTRINLFVRLWRKLGWSIAETDRALQAFIPSDAHYDATHLADRPFATALVYLAHLSALEQSLRAGKRTREKLITLWTPLSTTGARPLYADLFLGRAVLQHDPVFDDPFGRYLATPGIALSDHALALQGALGLSAADIERILTANGSTLATAELTIDSVSLLHRHALLAKALKVSVAELLALRELTGLDPFTAIASAPLTTLSEDAPFTQTIHFVDTVRSIKASGFKVDELVYLLRHQFDANGPYRQHDDAQLTRVKLLSDGMRAIRATYAVPADPGAIDDEALRQTLALVLPSDVIARLTAMIAGTVEFTVAEGGVLPADALVAASFENEPAIRQVQYNATTRQQSLTVRGVLFDPEKAALTSRFPSPLFARLVNAAQAQAREFFDRWLLRRPPGVRPESGFLLPADFAVLFAPDAGALTPDQQQIKLRDRRAALASSFLPYLQQQLIRQLVVRTLAAELSTDAELVEALVTEPELLSDPAPLIEAFSGVSTRGVDVTAYASTDASGPPLVSLVLSDADTTLRDGNGAPLIPAGSRSARVEGFVEVPTPGAYRIHIALEKKDATATVRFAHLPSALIDGIAATDAAELSEFTVLKAGVPYAFSILLQDLGGGSARALVQGEAIPKDRLGRLALYPASVVERANRASVLLSKTVRLMQGLQLSERELRYILTHAVDFGGVDFSALPTRAADDSPAGAQALFAQWKRLAAYTQLKSEIAGGGDGLLDVFATPTPDAAYAVLATLTRRDVAVVQDAATTIFAVPALVSEEPVGRVWQLLQLVERFGVSVRTLARTATVVSTALPAGARQDVAKGLREAVRARFDEETWYKAAPAVFDPLRQRQRDALAAHVMHQHGFDSINQLYEYFLIDPGMEPVVQTSRIRLAIASVQLFIQRCLLNLEAAVHPSVINASQWEWMKRYRVWEANRKIFLFPENWLEPEFRDDKTHLFTELETALLQGDLSNDLAEDAFLAYLQKLEGLARLEIVGLHCQDDGDATQNTLHVIGRTYTQPYQFYYRRFSNRMWTPWEPMGVEAEGNHLAPVFWRNRLYLFWVTFLEQGAENDFPSAGSVKSAMTSASSSYIQAALGYVDKGKDLKSSPPKKLAEMSLNEIASGTANTPQYKSVQAHLHWAEYLQGSWTPGKTGAPDHVITARVPASFDSNSVFVHVSVLHDADGEEGAVRVHMGGAFNRAFHLAGRNSVPENAPRSAPPAVPYPNSGAHANRYRGSGALSVTFTSRISTEDGKPPVLTSKTEKILAQGGTYTILPADNAITLVNAEVASMVTPFFYQDNSEQTFFVEPSFTEKTIEQWEEWVTRTPVPDYDWSRNLEFFKDNVAPALPRAQSVVPINPRDPLWSTGIGSESLFAQTGTRDWLLNDSTALHFGDQIVGPSGRAAVTPLADRSQVLATTVPALQAAGLAATAGSTLQVVGSQGFNAVLRGNSALRLNKGL